MSGLSKDVAQFYCEHECNPLTVLPRNCPPVLATATLKRRPRNEVQSEFALHSNIAARAAALREGRHYHHSHSTTPARQRGKNKLRNADCHSPQTIGCARARNVHRGYRRRGDFHYTLEPPEILLANLALRFSLNSRTNQLPMCPAGGVYSISTRTTDPRSPGCAFELHRALIIDTSSWQRPPGNSFIWPTSNSCRRFCRSSKQ